MKRNISLNSALFLLLSFSLLLPSCSEDLPGDAPAPGQSLRIHVDDSGYTATSQTRAQDTDYQTLFTAGDKIGVFAVKDGVIVQGINNLCLTATSGSSGDLIWAQGGSSHVELSTNATYYAYYPWQDNLTGDLDPTAGNAAGFFANVITAWSPADDQSDYAKYTAQDLMIADGSLSGKSLTFSMAHQMALVVIDLPKTVYTLKGASGNDLPDYTVPVSTEFSGNIPWFSGSTYRYLVKPQSSNIGVKGTYISGDKNGDTWNLDSKVASAGGNYKVFKVDNATVTSQSHQLQAGDFFMKDGSLVGKDVELSRDQKAACIGVVYWVGDDAVKEDPLLRADYPGCTHGLVVALKEAGSMHWSDSYEYVQNWVKTENGNPYKDVVNLQAEDKRCGYSNTLALKDYNAGEYSSKVGSTDAYRVLPIDAIEQYAVGNPAPANSSGWYFPSVMELQYVCWGQGYNSGTEGKKNLNTNISKVGGTVFVYDRCWSSTESSSGSYYARNVNFDGGYLNLDVKYSNAYHVRPLLAF